MFVCLFACSGRHYCLQEALWETGQHIAFARGRTGNNLYSRHSHCVIARIFQNEHIHVFENTFIWFISLTISSWKAGVFYFKYVHFLNIKLILDRAKWLDGFTPSSFKLTAICSSVIPLFLVPWTRPNGPFV